jgi:hypothetical protein
MSNLFVLALKTNLTIDMPNRSGVGARRNMGVKDNL